MNVGQILEVHLGWAAKGLGQQVDRMLKQQRKVDEVRAYMEQIYNSSGRPEDIQDLSDAEIMDLAQNLRRGVPFATPVFDGAKEEEIKHMLSLAYPDEDPRSAKMGFNPSKTQLQLYDGRSGEAFDRKTTVGVMHFFGARWCLLA